MFKNTINSREVSKNFRSFSTPIILQLITSVANLLPALYLVKVIGLSAFGKYSLCFLIIMISREFFIAMVLTPMGILLPKISVNRLHAYKGILIANLLAFILTSSLFISLVVSLLGSYSQLTWFSDNLDIIILVNFASCLCEFFKRYFLIISRGALAIAIEVIKFLMYISLLFLMESLENLGYQNALLLLAFSFFLTSFLGLCFFGSIGWSAFLFKGVMFSHAKFIKWSALTTFVKSFLNASPVFLLSIFFSEASVGLFRSCQQIAHSAQIPIIAVSQLGSSRASKILKTNGVNDFNVFIRQIFLLAVIIVVPIIILVLASAPILQTFLEISSDEFLSIIIILILGNLLVVVRLPVLVYLEVMQLPNLIAYSQSLALFVGLPLAYVLISYAGVIGASGCYIIFNGLSLLFLEFFSRPKRRESAF